MSVVIYDRLDGSGGSSQQGMYAVTRGCIVEGVTGIISAINAVPNLGTTWENLVLTNINTQATLPDSQAVKLSLTYTMNFGILQSNGSSKSEQWSYDKNGNVVNVAYTPAGGKKDEYTGQFAKLNPQGSYIGSRYEEEDALTFGGDYLDHVNSAPFMGFPAGTMMLVACEGDNVAPGWFNNRYTFLFDPNGFNPVVAYYDRWGKIPKNIAPPGIPPQAPVVANGYTIPDEYNSDDFATIFAWMETLL